MTDFARPICADCGGPVAEERVEATRYTRRLGIEHTEVWHCGCDGNPRLVIRTPTRARAVVLL